MIDSHQSNLGLEFSGVVVSDGRHFQAGDCVAGSIDFTCEEKSMAEYVAVAEDYLAKLPNDLSFVTGAALPI